MIAQCPVPIKIFSKRKNKVIFGIYCSLCRSWNCPRGYCQQYLCNRWDKNIPEMFNQATGYDKIYVYDGPADEWKSLVNMLNYRKADFVHLDIGTTFRAYVLFQILFPKSNHKRQYLKKVESYIGIVDSRVASLDLSDPEYENPKRPNTLCQVMHPEEAIGDCKDWIRKLPNDRKRISTSRGWRREVIEEKPEKRMDDDGEEVTWELMEIEKPLLQMTIDPAAMKERLHIAADNYGLPSNYPMEKDGMDAMEIPLEWWDNEPWRVKLQNYIDRGN